MLTAAGFGDRGCVRSINQDRLLVDPHLGLFIVADGMGGHRHGEVAAEVAIQTMRNHLAAARDAAQASWPFGYNESWSGDANRLATAIQVANRAIWERSEESLDCAGMGTTIAAILCPGAGDAAVVANAGDSRIYLLRSGALRQLSTDDTWVQSIAGRRPAGAAAMSSPVLKSVLTQAAGSREPLNVHVVEMPFEHGDELMACSDGLHGVVPEDDLLAALTSGEPAHARVRRLVEAARERGGPDNISCLVVRYERDGSR